MSHIVTIETKVHDPMAMMAACQRLALPLPTQGTATLFSGEATGILVQLPGWHYPVIVDPISGTFKYDNYEGRWGAQSELAKFLQAYAVEKTKLEARRKGYQVTEQTLHDGSIRLEVVEGY